MSAGRQALLVLAHLRCGHTYAQLAASLGVDTAIDVLAALAPTLAEAMKTASTKAFVMLDGTLLPIDRIAADRPFYSGKHQEHGMNVQVITDPMGRLLWALPALLGAVHDVQAAREHDVARRTARTLGPRDAALAPAPGQPGHGAGVASRPDQTPPCQNVREP